MIRKLPWTEILVIALALGAGAAVYVYAHRDEGRLEQSKERGAQIVAALMSYQAEHGTYPATLEALVPVHLDSVPQPTWGLAEWGYRRYTPTDVATAADTAVDDVVYFHLSVAASESGYPLLYYDVPLRRWVVNN